MTMTATVSRNRGDGAAKVSDEGIKTRPKKPPDAGCTKLKIIDPGLLNTGLMVILLMLMLTNPTLIIKRNGTLLKTKSVMMNPIMRMSGHVQMGTYGADNEPPDIEDEVGDNEENHIKTITLPTVGKIIGA